MLEGLINYKAWSSTENVENDSQSHKGQNFKVDKVRTERQGVMNGC